jgi:effector-binding domain-containing protein
MKTRSLLGLLLTLTALPLMSQNPEPEQKWSNTPIEIQTVDAMKALVIKADVPMNQISTKIGEIYRSVFSFIQQNSIQPAGPAFAVYYSWDPNANVVMEAGVPVTGKVETAESIEYKEFPEMKAVTTLYTGAYENMQGVYGAIQQYMSVNSIETTGASWEVYLTDPGMVTDPSQNKTIIYFPVKSN